jgi:hypothetical protein
MAKGSVANVMKKAAQSQALFEPLDFYRRLVFEETIKDQRGYIHDSDGMKIPRVGCTGKDIFRKAKLFDVS